MALRDGDDAINGKFFPFQMYNRFKNFWRQAAPKENISNPQAGMIVNDSNDERLHVKRAADWGEILQADKVMTFEGEVLVFEGDILTWGL